MSRRLLLLLALASGVAVGNIYFPQALSPLVASGLGVSPESAALVVTAAQVGYAIGIFLLVPLGDRVSNRPLIVVLMALTGLSLLAAAAAPALPALLGAGVLAGVTTVIAPIIGAMAAGLVPADRRGVVSGTLLSGSIGGMLLSRTFGGALGEWWGWRAPYLVAAIMVLLFAVVMALAVPPTSPPSRQPYPALLAASVRVLWQEPELRRSCFYQATVFGGFQAVWTGIALVVTGPVFGLDARAVGVLALVGAVTMVCTPIAGRLVDRVGSDPVNLVCLVGAIGSAGVLALGVVGGTWGMAALVVGTLLLDVAMQCGMVANVARIYGLRPEVRGRLNTAYMTCAFLGGSTGSWLGATAYAHVGWTGVCGLVGTLSALGLLGHLLHRGRASRAAGTDSPVAVGTGAHAPSD